MRIIFDQTDFSVAVKNRARLRNRGDGRYIGPAEKPIECSSVFYETVEAANRAGKEALKQLLTEFPD
jgi:hypothetical protein